MLYPKNQMPRLSEELFRHPTSEYRAAPFWAWNCKLEKDELLRQLDVLRQMGMGGAHMHVRTGMGTPYLSDEFMSLIRACTDKCKNEKMLAWLYDEDRWPSGAAGGIVTREEKYRARHLLFTTMPATDAKGAESHEMSGSASRSDNGRLLACYDVELDDAGCLQHSKRIAEDEVASGVKWYAYVETDLPNPWYNGQTYVNTLDKAAIQRFIDVTYERYLDTVGDDFGGVVPAIFTDEPQFSRKSNLGYAKEQKDVILPWTDDLPDTFRAAYGEELLDGLPELIWELPQGKISVLRYHYHDHIAERFASAFADQCGAWCAGHELMLTGHMMSEPSLESQSAALGEAMRSYRSFQLPGIDNLCGIREFTTAKQAQSAVHQYGRPGMLSELYGVTGWPFDFRGHKLHGDWQAALGVTVRVPHLSWVSMKGEAKRDYPASINYQSPWWQDYALVEDHFARVNTAMTRGKPVVRVGVIHPVESYWLHWGPSEQTHAARQRLESQFSQITDWLLLGSVDFDFISESLLPSLNEKGGAPLTVGEMAYDVVIVPGCETLRSTTLERLETFHEAGGQLVFMGDAPSLTDAIPSSRGAELYAAAAHIPFTQEAVMNAVAPVRMVDIRDRDGMQTGNLLHQLREDADGLWLFVAQSGEPYNKDVPRRQDVQIVMKGAYHVHLYDTPSGEILPIRYETRGDKTIVHAALHDYDSLLLRFDQEEAGQPAAAADKHYRRLPVPELVDYTLHEPNVLLLDKAEFALDDGEYDPAMELLRADNVFRAKLGWPSRQGAVAQPWTVPEELAEHYARLRFTIYADQFISDAKLAMEDAALAHITLNGEPIPVRIDGWFVDKCIQTVALPALREGANTLEIALPITHRDGLEWCYLLGDFGVEIMGAHRTLTARREKIGFSDWAHQRLPHYTGNMTYRIPVHTQGGKLRVTAPHYRGAAIRVALDGRYQGYIVYSPYQLVMDAPAGEHELQLTVLGHRENAFGPVHNADAQKRWIGPDIWRTTGASWTDSYRLAPMGLLSAPVVEEEV